VSTAEDPATDTGHARVRLDRPVLVGNLVSGAVWLWPLAIPWSGIASWPAFVIGAMYVVAGGVFLAAVYAHEGLTGRQEVLAWIAPWLSAVALWAVLIGGTEFENTVSHYLMALGVGLLIATPLYLVWQIVALAVRQLIAWRSGGPTRDPAPGR
jgi:hypothetical protein